MKFYVVHTYTGREKRVKELVEKAIERLNQPGLFGRVIMPAEKTMTTSVVVNSCLRCTHDTFFISAHTSAR